MPRAFPAFEKGSVTLEGEAVDFSVVRSPRRRRTVAFKLEADLSVRVLAPMSASLKSIQKVLEGRSLWIVRQREVGKKGRTGERFVHGARVSYLGYACRLHVSHGGEAETRSCVLSPGALRVRVPDACLSAEALRDEVRLELLLWLKRRARIKFKKRLEFWAARLGVRYQKFVLTSPTHRWGSCSVDNVIRLNWKLIMAPLSIVDYIVVHELAHIVHKNHSPRFWAFVARALPDYAARREALRRFEQKLVFEGFGE